MKTISEVSGCIDDNVGLLLVYSYFVYRSEISQTCVSRAEFRLGILVIGG